MMRTFRGGLLIGLLVAIAVAAAAITYERYDTKTLKRTIRRGEVLCGVNTGLPGFSIPDDKGNWSGFDVDFCRAVAAAIFDDPTKAKFIPLDANERFKELQSRKVDILSRNSTWSMSRETNYDLYFPAVAYYDGEGFMLPRAKNIDSALGLDGSKVCVQDNTTTKLNLADYFRANNMKYQEMKFEKLDDVVKAYDTGKCDVLTADASQLYALRLNLSKPDDHTILPDIISKEPLAPVVRERDDDWMLIVKWTLYAMINAEELGITSKNIDEALEVEEARRDAAGRHRRLLWRRPRPDQGLGGTHHPPCRQLRRSLRAQRRRRIEAQDPARPQPALEQRRHPVRPADPVARRAARSASSSLRSAVSTRASFAGSRRRIPHRSAHGFEALAQVRALLAHEAVAQ